MKKIIIVVIVLVIILALGISFWLYKEEKENLKLDAESVDLKEDLSIEFGEKAKVSDFLASLNGKLVEDLEIDTESLGKKTVSFEYINIKNKKRKHEFKIEIVDVNAPKIFSSGSFTVKVRL